MSKKLRHRYGRAEAHMDVEYFRRVAETFMHPIIVGCGLDANAHVNELAALLGRIADRARSGR
jgi:hypothetical protein